MCVCCDIYIYIRVCEVKIFLPLKKGTIERKTQTRVRFTLSLSPSLFLSGLFRSPPVQIFRFSLWFEKKEEKKIESNFFSKKRGFFQESHHFLFLTLLLLRGIILSLCAYTLKRGLEKREKTSAYKSNNNNNNKRERKKEQF